MFATKHEGKGLLLKNNPALTGFSIFLLIIIAAFAVRAWGISFGLPYLYHPDEGHEVNRALQLGTGSFNLSRQAKGGYFYLIFAEFGVAYVLLKLFGVVESARDFGLLFLKDPTVFYWVGRLTTALIGTISVVLLYQLGTRMFSKQVGLIAALFLAFNALHVKHSHYITVDVPLTCLVLTSLIFIVRIYDYGNRADYVWAGVFLALATMMKLPGALLWLPLVGVHLLRWSAHRPAVQHKLISLELSLAVALFGVVFFAGNPGALLNFDDYIRGAFGLFERDDSAMGALGNGTGTTRFGFYLSALNGAVGLPIIVLSLVGMVFGPRSRRPLTFVFAVFVGCFFSLLSLSKHPYLYYHRYLLPIIPIIILFAAVAVERMLAIRFLGKTMKAAALILCVAIIADSSVKVFQQNLRFTAQDSRTEAKAWFDANVPAGARVLIEGHTARATAGTIPLRNSRQHLEQAMQEFIEKGETGKATFFRMELEAVGEKRFHLIFYYSRGNLEKWQEYKDMGVNFVVLRPNELVGSRYINDTEAKQFISDMRADPDVKRVAVFDGTQKAKQGPMIEVYQVGGALPRSGV